MFPVHHLIAGLIIALILLSILATAAVFLVLFIRHRRQSFTAGENTPDAEKGTMPKARANSDDGIKKAGVDVGPRRYSWKEIEKSTGGFEQSRVIGEGGFSTVYLASFTDGNSLRFAAVKVQRLRREFQHELDVLQGMRHGGVVRLIGYCDDRDEGALVFEYIPHGTLHDRLHAEDGGDQDRPPLPWVHRMSIAHQLASALQYLHETCDPHVIHADIKPSNVLLEISSPAACRSVLCDFGSARTGFSSAVTQSAEPAGCRRRGEQMVASPGYVDPHLLRTGVASRKSDVYSFGMVLMELVTGREAVGVDKREVARAVEAGTVRDMVDGRLAEGEYDEAEAVAIASLAVRCVGNQPSLRPSMGEVVKVLEEQMDKSIRAIAAGCRHGEKEQTESNLLKVTTTMG